MKQAPPIDLEIAGLRVRFNELAWSVNNFASVVDLSPTTIREDVDANRLIARYPRGRKRLIYLGDAIEWLESLPTEKP